MPKNFSEEQLTVIHDLAEILQKCKELRIHIAGISQYSVTYTEDADKNQFISLT